MLKNEKENASFKGSLRTLTKSPSELVHLVLNPWCCFFGQAGTAAMDGYLPYAT